MTIFPFPLHFGHVVEFISNLLSIFACHLSEFDSMAMVDILGDKIPSGSSAPVECSFQ
jgi:hypothetical protein